MFKKEEEEEEDQELSFVCLYIHLEGNEEFIGTILSKGCVWIPNTKIGQNFELFITIGIGIDFCTNTF